MHLRRWFAWVLAAVTLASSAVAETEVVLTFGGDCVLGTREEWVGQADNFEECVAEKGIDWCFSGVRSFFLHDDLTVLNLECVLQTGNQGHDWHKQHTFRGDPTNAAMLARSGVEQVTVSNNHFVDYGKHGREATLAALDAVGVAYSGYRELQVVEIGGHKIGFGGCRETVFKQQSAIVYRDIKALKEAGCEVIVYACHWGKEYSPTHNALQERMAEYAVKSGADIVVGTHPHVVQGVAALEGAAVLYSLGNLVFGGTRELATFDGMLCRATLRFSDEGKYEGVSLRLIPVLTSGSAPENDFRPVPAAGEDAARILALVQADSVMDVAGEMWIPCE